ncbi:LuxR C-terminal-related transcriptional regulator [Spirillospora sp. NPDC048911]|uniref:LuxR C-terminal-related transcriptional regulator n=1 Tax=Spirillospora sp. NPDC048911 TaxID=3364527 RepID=UPI003722570B
MLDRVLRLWDRLPDLPAQIGADRFTVMEMTAEACLNAGELDAGIAAATAALLITRAALHDRDGQDPLPDLLEATHLLPPASASVVRGRVLAEPATSQRNHRRLAPARASAEEALEIGRRTHDRVVQAKALVTLAALAAANADLATAIELYGEAGAAAAQAGAHDTQLLVAITESDTLEAAGEHARAAQVARQGMALAADLGLARTRGTLLAPNLSESLLSLGRRPEATEVDRAALSLAPPPLYQAYLQIIQATVDLRRGDTGPASAAAEQARAAMRGNNRGEESCLEPDLLDCRLAQVTQDAGAVAAIIGHVLDDHDLLVSPRYGWPLLYTAAQSLNDHRQGEGLIQRLVDWSGKLTVTGRLQRAYQLSNRQIGEQLYISAKTAGVHVSNILAKLGVTTRLEAAAWAHRTRLFG